MERRDCTGYADDPSTHDKLTLTYQSGDKSNHIPSLHVPQLYYFIASATIFGWPALIGGDGGAYVLLCEVRARMFGGKRFAVICKLGRTDAQLAFQARNDDCGVIGIHGCYRPPLHVSAMDFIGIILSIIHIFHITSIHHPFLLSDNRHYTFYVWRRIFLLHPTVPYIFIPGYIACAWAWFLRVGEDCRTPYKKIDDSRI